MAGFDIGGVQHLCSIAKVLEQRRSENVTVKLGLQINNKSLNIPVYTTVTNGMSTLE
jgi:hypothetical protein